MKHFVFFLLIISFHSFAQSAEENDLLGKVTISNTIPTDLLSARSAVIYQKSFTKKELEETQGFFQQTGIDAVAYFEVGRMLAGEDTRRAYSAYFSARVIKYLIFLQKNSTGYQYIFCSFSGTKELIEKNGNGWKQENTSLNELLKTIYRFAVSNLKKQNFLINDLPEMDISINPFTGRINETFPVEVKSFKTAIPKFGNAKDDAELEAYFKENFPLKYELVEADLAEDALYAKGFRTVLRFVHTRGIIAKDILGYDISQIARAIPTATYVNNEVQIKTIPASEVIYKFYFKNLEYGNIFLGNKWDADIRWQDALRNYIQAYKINQKIN